MAQNETWLNHDLMQAVKVQYLDGNVFSMDNAGNLIGVHLTRGGVDYSGGGTVSANVIRADGATVAVSGAISGAYATIVLPQAAYAVPGVLSVIIKLTVSGEITTIGAVVANVYQSTTDSVVDPGTIIPSVETLIAEIDAAIASIPADYSNLWSSLAPNFSTSTNYSAGQYVTYGDPAYVYRFTSAHAAGSWIGTDATQVSIGNDVSWLRSDFEKRCCIVSNDIDNILMSQNYFDLQNITCYDYSISGFIPVDFDDEINSDSGTNNHWLYLAIPLKNMESGAKYFVNVIIHTLQQAYFSSSNIGGQGTTSEAIYFSQNSATYLYTHNPIYKYLIVRFTGAAHLGFNTYAIDGDYSQRYRYMAKSAQTSDYATNSGVRSNLTLGDNVKNLHGNIQDLTKVIRDSYMEITSEAFEYTGEFSIVYGFISYDITSYVSSGSKLFIQQYVGSPGELPHYINLSTAESSYANSVLLRKDSVNSLVEFEIDCANLPIDTSGSVYLQIGVQLPKKTNIAALYSWNRVVLLEEKRQGVVVADYVKEKYSWFYGKTIAVIGDSIAQGNRWQPHVSQYFGCHIDTYAIGGTTVSNNGQRVIYEGNEIDAWMSSDDRVNLVVDNPDAIFIIGGHNDYGNNIPLGEIGEHPFDDTQFKPAYSLLIKKLVDKFPNAKIYSLGVINGKTDVAGQNMIYQPLNTLNLCMTDYAKAVKDVCEYYGIPCFDIGANSWINVFNHTTYILDTIHPNDDGGRLLANSIINGMKRYEPIKLGVY